MLARDSAAHASLDDPGSVASLLDSLWQAGAGQQVTEMADRAASQVFLDNPLAVAMLLEACAMRAPTVRPVP